ncbi:MAG: hypothetical protein ACK5HL_03845 [Bacilli bacterium]
MNYGYTNNNVSAFNINNFLSDVDDNLLPVINQHRTVLVPKVFIDRLKKNFQAQMENSMNNLDMNMDSTEEIVEDKKEENLFDQLAPTEEEPIEKQPIDDFTNTENLWNTGMGKPIAMVSEFENTMKSLANVVGTITRQRSKLTDFSKTLVEKEQIIEAQTKDLNEREHIIRNKEKITTKKELDLSMREKSVDSAELKLKEERAVFAEALREINNDKQMFQTKIEQFKLKIQDFETQKSQFEQFKLKENGLIQVRIDELEKAKAAMESMILGFIKDISNVTDSDM